MIIKYLFFLLGFIFIWNSNISFSQNYIEVDNSYNDNVLADTQRELRQYNQYTWVDLLWSYLNFFNNGKWLSLRIWCIAGQWTYNLTHLNNNDKRINIQFDRWFLSAWQCTHWKTTDELWENFVISWAKYYLSETIVWIKKLEIFTEDNSYYYFIPKWHKTTPLYLLIQTPEFPLCNDYIFQNENYLWKQCLLSSISPYEFAKNYHMTSMQTLDLFRPYDFITRQESTKMFMTILFAKYRYAKQAEKVCTLNFRDEGKFDKTLRPYIYHACWRKIMKGSWLEFMPHDTLTKGQAITILMRMFEKEEQEPINGSRRSEYARKAMLYWYIENEPFENFEQPISRMELIIWIQRFYNKYLDLQERSRKEMLWETW